MITFRYHVVTLVAVFMAIGLGVLFGATFIDQNIVEGLKASQARLGTRNETLRQRILEEEKLNEQLSAFTLPARDRVVSATLEGRNVLLLSLESTPREVRDGYEETMAAAGAAVFGRVTFADELDLQSEDARKRLAVMLGSASTQAAALGDQLGTQVAGELLAKNPAILQKLMDGGLAAGQVTPLPVPVPGGPVPPALAVVILTGEGSKELNDRLVLPLARALAVGPVLTAVVEPGVEGAVVGPLRDGSVQVVTVDSAETAVSQALTATGLRAAAAGQFGSYGFGEGATTAVPAV